MRFTAIMILSLSLLLVGCSNRTILIDQGGTGGGGETFTYTWTDPGQPAIDPLEDNSGQGNNLTNTGTAYVSSVPGYSINGSTQYLSMPAPVFNFINDSNNYTLRVKIRFDELTLPLNNEMSIMSFKPSSGVLRGVGFAIGNYTGQHVLLVRARNATAQYSNTFLVGVVAGNEYDIVVNYDNTNKRILSYVNGVLMTNVSHTIGIIPNFLGRIGSGNLVGGTSNYVNSLMYEANVWNRSLSATEVAIVYANGTVSDGLVAWYPFVNQSYVAPQNYSTLQIPLTPEPLAAPPGTFWADVSTNDSYIQGPSGWEALS
jgi:hypothetical protein